MDINHPKTTQRLHQQPIATPAGPILLTHNPTAGWFELTLPPGELPSEYLRPLIFALQEADKARCKLAVSTMRKKDEL
jgi:hypothetical protein